MTLPPAAAAQERTPTPSARELWRSYPLQPDAPTPGPTEERAALASPGPGATREAVPRAGSGARPDTGGGAPVALLGIAGVLAALGAGLVARRRRGPRPKLAMPLLTAAATTAALSERPRPARLTTLTAAPGRSGREPRQEDAGWRTQDLHPPDLARPWTAELEWHGDGEGPRFCVTARSGEGGQEALIALSEPIEWPPPDAAAVQRLRRSVARIEAAVRSAGWTPLPSGEAWYSKRFAWAPVALPAPATEPAPPRGLFDPPPPWPEGTQELWRCEIRWRAGYINSRFTVVTRRAGHKGTSALGRSETFKWMIMADPEPPSPELLAAVERLDEQVTAAGWEPAGLGREWWERRYVWRREEPPPPDLEPSPERVGARGGGDD